MIETIIIKTLSTTCMFMLIYLAINGFKKLKQQTKRIKLIDKINAYNNIKPGD